MIERGLAQAASRAKACTWWPTTAASRPLSPSCGPALPCICQAFTSLQQSPGNTDTERFLRTLKVVWLARVDQPDRSNRFTMTARTKHRINHHSYRGQPSTNSSV
jgi:hypothetical protein